MSAAASVVRAQEALRAGRRARIVQHALLVPAREEDAAQMRFAVEDALNTADFGDCGRLIVVRRLRLHAVPPSAGSALIARALEAAWRALAVRAVPASHPHARDADAVFFASRFEARVTWLKLVAARADVDAWYWAAALPELKHAAAARDVPASIEIVIEALLQESAVETSQALRAWPDDTTADLARRLTEPANRRLLEVLAPSTASVRAVAPEAGPASRVAAARKISAAWHPIVRRLARQAPLSEAAASWITALWVAPLLGRQPTPEQVHAVVTRAARVASASHPDAVVEPAARAMTHDPASVSAPLGTTEKTRARDAAKTPAVDVESTTTSTSQNEARPTAWRMESGLRTEPRLSAQQAKQRRSLFALPWLADAAPTDHGGLLCLINLLQSLRFERWLAQQPPAARQPFADALFEHVLSECGATPDDPQHAWFALPICIGRSDLELEGPIGVPRGDMLSSGCFIDGGSTLDANRTLRLWRLRMRHALRRYVGMDLQAVVQRPAWVSGTPTHLDVVFPLDEVDLRLRRHGLDSDPGWLPWFGRIVAFHFVASELLPQRDDEPGASGG